MCVKKISMHIALYDCINSLMLHMHSSLIKMEYCRVDLWQDLPKARFWIMTSSNGNIFRVTGPLWGNSPATGEFPSQRPVTQSFDVFFDLCLYKRLSKQFWGWWFETPSRSLWRQCDGDRISSSHLKNPGRRYERNIEKSALSLY